MTRLRRSVLGWGGALGLAPWLAPAPVHAQARRLLLVSHVLPPYTLPEGSALGPGIDVDYARAALRAAGGQFELEVLQVPWRRALQMLELGEADFTTSVHITDERARYLSFSETYGASVRHYFFGRRAEGLKVQHLDELAGYRIGVVAGHAFPEPLTAALGSRLERAKDLPTLLRMLVAQRVQLAVGTDLPITWTIRELGLQSELEQQPLVHDSGRRTQMGFSRARPGHEQALEAMNRGLRLLARGDSWKRLEARYLGA
ncbi:substrate-binding periplasmic protein [Inhella sp.]|uniref:substrate-binding periplasmic protein n=1 Tax=Inhella sp. TaxID=1921806 RepID=UPI0035B0257D